MTKGQIDFRTQVLLSMQRALWDMVTPELRGVAVGWGDGSVSATFLFDGPIDAGAREIVREVETYFLADFESITTRFEAIEHPTPMPRELDDLQWWAYLRREE